MMPPPPFYRKVPRLPCFLGTGQDVLLELKALGKHERALFVAMPPFFPVESRDHLSVSIHPIAALAPGHAGH